MRLESLSDGELIDVVKSKSEYSNSAIGTLYTKYYNAICCLSKSVLGNKEDAEDNVNDVFCKIFLESNDINKYKEKGSFKSWILSITHNTAVSKLRKRNSQNIFLGKKINEPQFYNENGSYSNENMEIIRKESRKIGGIHLEIICMRDFFGMDYKEIENALNINPSTCRGRYLRAVDLLKRNLIKEYGEEQFLS